MFELIGCFAFSCLRDWNVCLTLEMFVVIWGVGGGMRVVLKEFVSCVCMNVVLKEFVWLLIVCILMCLYECCFERHSFFFSVFVKG